MGTGRLVLSWDEWFASDAVRLAELVRCKEVTPLELAIQSAALAALVNPLLNCVLEVFEDEVTSGGRARAHSKCQPDETDLFGVPAMVKDIDFAMQGRLQECGSTLKRGCRRVADDPATLNLRTAGLTLIGRTSVPPFAFSDVTESALHGVTRNPFDPNYSPGGSSGGSGAVVASGVVTIATASDQGGSLRSPASLCGLFGLKMTRGMVPAPLGTSEVSDHHTVLGVVTRTVRDQVRAVHHLSKHPRGYPSFCGTTNARGGWMSRVDGNLPRLTVAYNEGEWGLGPLVDERLASGARAIVAALEDLGHTVIPVDDQQVCDFRNVTPTLSAYWLAGLRRAVGSALRGGTHSDSIEPMLCWLYELSHKVDLELLWESQRNSIRWAEQLGRFFERYDILVTPSCALLPWRAGDSAMSPLGAADSAEDAEKYLELLISSSRYYWIDNDAGLPCVVVPTKHRIDGIPVGALIHGGWSQDGLLLGVARQLEEGGYTASWAPQQTVTRAMAT